MFSNVQLLQVYAYRLRLKLNYRVTQIDLYEYICVSSYEYKTPEIPLCKLH